MGDLSKRLDSVELSNARREAIITGLQIPIEEKKKERKMQIQAFMEEVLERMWTVHISSVKEIPNQ